MEHNWTAFDTPLSLADPAVNREIANVRGISTERIAVGDAEINVLTGGGGPPVLLLHGYPQTHVIWHKVAPLLASKLMLVIPDLPGYGASKGPAPDPANQNYSKRNIARLLAALMSLLGHEKFAVAGHDRGGASGFGWRSIIPIESSPSHPWTSFRRSMPGKTWIG